VDYDTRATSDGGVVSRGGVSCFMHYLQCYDMIYFWGLYHRSLDSARNWSSNRLPRLQTYPLPDALRLVRDYELDELT